MGIFDIIVNIIESFIAMSFIYFILRKNKCILSLFLMTFLSCINTSFCNYFLVPEIYLTLSGITITFLYACYLNKHEYLQNVFLALCIDIFVYFSVSCGMLLTSLFYTFPFYNGDAYIFWVILSKIIYIGIVFTSIKYIHKYHLLDTKKLKYILLAMFILDILYSCLSDIIFYNHIFDGDIIVNMFAINFLSLSLVIIFFETRKEQQQLLELQKSKLQLESQKLISEVNKKNLDETRKWKHDMKHVFNSLNYQLDNNNYKEAQNIINQYNHILDRQISSVKTGYLLLDYALAYRSQTIQDNQIHLFASYTSCCNPLDDTHFSILVGNLLDNAIENCEAIYRKQVLISICEKSQYFCIKIQNTIVHSVLEVNPCLVTTKDNPENHGIGLNNVKLLLNKYDGRISFEEDREYFTVKVIIPIIRNNEESNN